MNKYLKNFLTRGMMFSGFGPIVASFVYFCLSFSIENFSVSGKEIFLAVISTYLMAFVLAGASVFNQIEHWSLAKSTLCHFIVYYFSYVICYLLNSWIPFDLEFLLIFTGIFVVAYFIIWLSIYFSIKATSKKLNKIING